MGQPQTVAWRFCIVRGCFVPRNGGEVDNFIVKNRNNLPESLYIR